MSKENLTSALERLNREPTYSTYMAVTNIIDSIDPQDSQMPVLKIAVLRNFTLDPIIPVIKGEIALSGFYPVIYLGDYDTIAKDVFDPQSSLYEFGPDLVILAQWLEVLASEFVNRFLSLFPDQVNVQTENILETVSQFIGALRQHTNAPVLVNNFPLLSNLTLGILDGQSERYQTQRIIKLNQDLLVRFSNIKDTYLVDYMSLMARIGSEQGLDERYWQIGRAPIGRKALVSFGQEYGKFIRALYGKARKCLVLDCDNILWGGIVGEDGLEGIKLGEAYPGSCYRIFQREILNLGERGIILALCSKNNEDDVLEVLQTHSQMILRKENFSTWQINWEDKATNIRRIAQELNIGLDSMVFVDDSQFECDLVRQQLPQVVVLHLASEPSSFKRKLNERGYFDALVLSEEDKKRNQMYRDQTKRKGLSRSSGSLREYLEKLKMVAEVGLVDKGSVGRISQLTQKTNQFNLTTRRYSEGDIRTFMESPYTDVFYLKLADKISDIGLVGVAIIKYQAQEAQIDSFLLSCRAIGREVEDALLAHVFNHVKDQGYSKLLGCFLATKKNKQVVDFYQRQGFILVNSSKSGSNWELLVKDKIISAPSWIKTQIAEPRRKYARE